MYEQTGIHSDLQQIKNELIKDNHCKEIEDLKYKNHKLNCIIGDLIRLNKDILHEIISKHYMYALPVTEVELKPYTSKTFESNFLEIVNIPLNDIVINNFNIQLNQILSKYK